MIRAICDFMAYWGGVFAFLLLFSGMIIAIGLTIESAWRYDKDDDDDWHYDWKDQE